MLKRIVWCATGAMAVTSALMAQPSPVRLDVNADRVGQLNGLIRVPSSVIDITDDLMPALAAMTPAQRGWSNFMSDRSPGFAKAKAWAQGDTAQRAIRAAIDTTDPEETRAIGLPYGAAGVDPAWVNAGVCVTMSGDGLLYSMEFRYLDRMEDLFLAMSVDAWAKAMEGDGDGVRELIAAWVRLARIVADREMADEKRFAYEMIQAGVERLRDIVYSFPDLYDEAGYVQLIEDLDNRDLELETVRLPRGDRLEALQLIERTMEPEGGVDPAKFGVLLAGGGVNRERPLEMFGRTAQMNTLGERHEGWFRTFDELNKIYGDWWTRWETPDFHDTQLTRSPDYAAMDRASFTMLEQTMGELNGLFDLRIDTLAELFGTRSAMGVKAFEAKNNRFPPALAAVSPSFVRKLDVDPWSIQARFGGGRGAGVPRERFEKSDLFRFLVPIRDQRWGPREEKVPYAVEVTTGVSEFEAPPEAVAEPATSGARRITEEQWAAWEDLTRKQIAAGIRQQLSLSQQISLTLLVADQLQQIKNDRKKMKEFGETVRELSYRGQTPTDAFTEAHQIMVGYTSLTESNFSDFLADYNVFVTSEKGLAPALRELSSMRSPKMDDYIEIVRARAIEVIGDPPLGEEAAGGDSVAAVNSNVLVEKFTVSLTPDTFLLYSVWTDKGDDGARLVGPEGTDLLIWPPFESLKRAEAGY